MTTASSSDPLERLCAQLLQHRRRFSQDAYRALRARLDEALAAAAAAEPEAITVTTPTSRVQRLRLASLVDDKNLDTFYQQEWAQLAVSSAGRCYLVYRRRDGGDYALEWSPSTTLPATMDAQLPSWLAPALHGDENEDRNEDDRPA